MTRSGWNDVLARESAALDAADPLAHVFLERRRAVRVEEEAGGGVRVHTAHLEGVAVRSAGGFRAWSRTGGDGPCPFDPPLDRGRRLVRDLLDGVARVARRRVRARAEWAAEHQEVQVGRPGGWTASDVRSGERVRLEVAWGTDPRVRAAVGEAAGRSLRIDLRALAAEVVARAEQIRDALPANPGERPAVLAPGVGGILVHELVGHALEGDTHRHGSPALGNVGDRVGSPGLQVLDDPRRGRVGWKIDDEGSETRPLRLVHDGRIAGRLHDLRSAARAGEPPTGHARCAGFGAPPLSRLGCTFVAAGPLAPEEVLEGVTEGLYVRRMEAADVDTRAGVALFRVTDADRIEHGRITHPLGPCVLRVRTLSALSTLDRIARDLAFDRCVGRCLRDSQPLSISVGAPTLRLGVVEILG